MKGFIRTGDSLVNIERLIMVVKKSAKQGNHFYPNDYYFLGFDTEQKLMLSLEEGESLMEQCHSLGVSIDDGKIATTSERST